MIYLINKYIIFELCILNHELFEFQIYIKTETNISTIFHNNFSLILENHIKQK